MTLDKFLIATVDINIFIKSWEPIITDFKISTLYFCDLSAIWSYDKSLDVCNFIF